MRKERGFLVLFGNVPVGVIVADDVEKCKAALGLKDCDKGCFLRWAEESPHGHIPVKMFDPTPRGGDRPYWLATLPMVGDLPYHFDADHLEPEPVVFRPIEIYCLEPASKQ